MKANEAPKKIYMSPAGVLYKGDKQQCNDIEYTRADAFIEKACAWLKENIYQHIYKQGEQLGFPTAVFLEEFKKAMKLWKE